MPRFTIQLIAEIPQSSASAFADAMTDADNDVIFLAQQAIRDRLNVDDIEQVDLLLEDDSEMVKATLQQLGTQQDHA